MVDNRGISPVSGYFKSGDANSSANKMSDEKQGQGGEYFASEMQEEENNGVNQANYQDRSAILRASLNGLAAANCGMIQFVKNQKTKPQTPSEEKEIEKLDKEEELIKDILSQDEEE